LTSIEKARTILESIDSVANIDWNFEEFYVKAIIKALADIEKEETGKKRPGRKHKVPIEQIQELRKQGLTKEKIAQQLNISLSTVRTYTKGGVVD
jgi:DNA-binding NarL/FixJ family response regulator